MMTDNDLCASMRVCLVFEFWAAAVLFSIDLGWEHTPFETISRKWWYASVGPEVWFGEVRIETIRRIGSVLWTIWDAAIISVQEIFSFNVLHFARRYQLKSPVIITRFPSISQVFLPIVPTRRPGWQLASGCCYCYYTPDNDSTHTHCWLHKSHDFSSVCSHVRLIFRILGKAHVHVCWLLTEQVGIYEEVDFGSCTLLLNNLAGCTNYHREWQFSASFFAPHF